MGTLNTELKARSVTIGQKRLDGDVVLPRKAMGLVIFAHGSGSSRFSARNTHVAHELEVRGLGTLLLDLLTEREAYDGRKVFDIPLLAGRMVEAVRFAGSDTELSSLRIGLFGASTGAAAALVAAAQPAAGGRRRGLARRPAGPSGRRAQTSARRDAADRRRRRDYGVIEAATCPRSPRHALTLRKAGGDCLWRDPPVRGARGRSTRSSTLPRSGSTRISRRQRHDGIETICEPPGCRPRACR